MKKLAVLLVAMGLASISWAQNVAVSGSVVDSQSKPVSGATVHLLNSNVVTVTDADGAFSIKNVAAGRYNLQITAVGFASAEKTVTAGDDLRIVLAENTTQLDDVIVSAEKKEEDLQSVPGSISSISSARVAEYRIWNTKDITAIVPNFYAANPGDGRNVTSIRGVTTTSYDPSIATYVDGVNQFGLDTYIAQLFDVERIEVLRGPQGTLYGRNAMGGVVNVITKQPGNIANGFVEASIGNFSQQRFIAAVRTPLIKDKLFFGIAGVYDINGGFYTNDFDNSKFDKKHSVTGNYYLKYVAGERWAITLNLKHNQNRNSGAFPLNYVSDALAKPFHLNQDARSKMIDNILNTSLSAVYAGEKFNFSTQTSYQSNNRFYKTPIDADFSPADAYSIVNNYGRQWNNIKVFTEEIKFSSPATASSFHWTTGAYLFYQDSPNKQGTHFGADSGLDPSTAIVTTKASSAGGALFGQATYALSEKVSITGGLRYDVEHKKQNVVGEYQQGTDPAIVTRPDTSASLTFHAFSPKVNISWRVSEKNNVYASYARGFRTGGLTPLSSDPSQLPLYPYKPEYSNNIEFGLKNTLLENRLRFNLAFYYIAITDAQTQTFIIPNTVITNAGSLTSKGMELEVSANPFRGFQLDYSLGLNSARYNNTDGNGKYAGHHQIYTPPVTSMAAAQYTHRWNENKCRAFLRIEWMYLGKKYFKDDADGSLSQSDYSLINSRLGFACKNFELSLWGRNLGDKVYIDYAYDFGVVHLGNPRNFGVTVRQSF